MSYKEKREMELKKEAEEKAAKAAAEVSFTSGVINFHIWLLRLISGSQDPSGGIKYHIRLVGQISVRSTSSCIK